MDLVSVEMWVGFFAMVFVMLAVDLRASQHRHGELPLRTAAKWTAFWIGLALCFNVVIYFWHGSTAALTFLAAYLLEKSLSVDNIFVFVLIFTMFGVPPIYQRRVLLWGVLGALVMRGIFIFAGTALLHRFEWLIYVFGAFLIYTALKLARGGETEIHPESNPVLKLFRRFMPMTDNFVGERFFTRRNGVLMATPLLMVLIVVETTDVLFAVDSIPAVLALTQDPFLVYTSNVWAILGLRALYFLLAGMIKKFHYLKLALSVILGYVGLKMLVSGFIKIPIGLSLGIIAGVLTLAIVASVIRARNLEAASPPA